jgi:probable HAF family extracellular repeat protein
MAVNDRGQVVGFSSLPSDPAGSIPHHACLWSRETGMIDLGAIGGSYSVAQAVNDDGRAVGYAGDENPHAFLWTPKKGMWDLGTLGGTFSVATAVNNMQQVIGCASLRDASPVHAFSWPAERMVTWGAGRS